MLYRFICFVMLAILPTCVNAFELYVSLDGDDDNNGTYEAPIATLQKANDLLESFLPDEDVYVYIISDRGTYEIENIEWTYSNSKHKTTLTSFPDSIKASFTASGYIGRAFITFRIMDGEPSNIHVTNFSIKNCSCRAFIFRGDSEDPSGWNGSNSIINCSFNSIGNYNYPDKDVVYSVIGFVNSRNNEVKCCEFIDIKNHTAATYPQKRIQLENKKKDKKHYPNILDYGRSNRKAGGHNPNLPIIGIYFAHHCDSNTVSSNVFLNVKGDLVRIRDNSNNLVFTENTAILCGWSALITSWYRKGEAPSYSVLIENNKFTGNWLYGVPRVFKDKNKGIADNSYDDSIVIRNNSIQEHERLH